MDRWLVSVVANDVSVREPVSLPIVFITGYGDIPMTVKAMKAGAVEFLTMPWSEDALLGLPHAP